MGFYCSSTRILKFCNVKTKIVDADIFMYVVLKMIIVTYHLFSLNTFKKDFNLRYSVKRIARGIVG